MEPVKDNPKLIDNTEKNQFEMRFQGKTARIEYIRTADKIFLTHTEVPRSLEGQGVGSRLVQAVLEEIVLAGLPLVPLCPFVAAYIKDHPKWQHLVHKGIRIK